MSAEDLTTKQQRILNIIETLIDEHGRPPTVRDITRAGGYKSTRSAQQYISTLVSKGVLVHEPGLSRGLQLATPPRKGIPVLGRVPAGTPWLAEESIEDWIDVEDWFDPGHANEGRHFGVKVVGHSMRNTGILDGDTVIVRRQDTVPNGEIAVVYLDGEATVKRVFKTAEQITLQPENSEFEPIIVPHDAGIDVRFAGPVVGVIRRIS